MIDKYLIKKGILDDINKVVKEDKYNIHLTNTSENFDAFLVNQIFESNNDNIFVNASNLYKAQKLYDKLSAYNENVLFFPFDDFINDELLASSDEFKFERINTIVSLLKNKKNIIVTHTSSFLRQQLPRDKWLKSLKSYKLNDIIDIKEFTEELISYGYNKLFTVEQKGQFSVRGSIIDIYPYDSDKPYRIDLFDDEIDSIRVFDPENQKSIEKVNSFSFYPINEFFYNQKEADTIASKLKATGDSDFVSLLVSDVENRNNVTRLHKLISLIHEENTIADLVKNKIVIYEDFDAHVEVSNNLLLDIEDLYLRNKELGMLDIKLVSEIPSLVSRIDRNIYSNFRTNSYPYLKYTHEISIPTRDLMELRSIDSFISSVSGTTIIAAKDFRERQRFVDILNMREMKYALVGSKDSIEDNKINLIVDNLQTSFEVIRQDIKVVSSNEFFKEDKTSKIKYRSVLKQEQRINNIDEIKPGDFIVHYDYGIGRYQGIKAMELQGIKGDFISVSYKDGDSLYIPVEKIKLLSKYVASEGSVPKLSKLGGADWERTKQKVRTKIKELAFDLLKVYAKREEAKGFIYSKDTKEMMEFEASFPYEETPDQLKAINEVKNDMHSTRPMDRLVCGDVGYGKTEVAVRAAFKACLDGKQVAVLAPTTVLSRQHYKTFSQRFEQYGLRVELLNRFRTPKEVTEIIKGLQEGYIDVVVGTHRLLSKDIKYKDLGLMVIDEEQRFGVEHKEIIKTMKVNIDVLTLTATPIPRTLQMSIMGIKDVSLLNTPPKNRYPVQTYVLDFDEQVVKNAIERELARDGQVFILYNKTQDIDLFSLKIQNLVADAKVRYAHGKMNREDLEDSVNSFINKEFNVLVCTTIIETGIDIPNANTIIITDADRLGLSQLYQIRGRVGRSDKIAYAYLMYKKEKRINEEAAARLKAIKEFTELGSGFKIAMRDLSIRGAGDVLGSEQSGFIDGVGLDLYMKMLDQEIKVLKGQQVENTEVKANLKFDVATHIEDDYISDESVKIDIHRKIDAIDSYESLLLTKAELEDRFGELSYDNYIYLEEKLFENYAKKYEISKVDKTRNVVSIRLSEKMNYIIDGAKLFNYCNTLSKNIKLETKMNKITITIDTLKLNEHYLVLFNKILQFIMN